MFGQKHEGRGVLSPQSLSLFTIPSRRPMKSSQSHIICCCLRQAEIGQHEDYSFYDLDGEVNTTP